MEQNVERQEKLEKTLIEKLAGSLLLRQPKVEERFEFGAACAELLDSGAFFYLLNGRRIRLAHSAAETVEGRRIHTKTAKCRKTEVSEITDELGEGKQILSVFEENGLLLLRYLILRQSGEITVQAVLRDKKGSEVQSRYIAPIDAPYPDSTGEQLFLSLDQKMLLVPYDNDMWARYESAVPRPGRTSYDVTAIYDERTFAGLVVGAVDFDVWKNAVRWAAHDARAFTAFCGVADGGTHDIMPHGIVSGKEVSSARFVMFWCDNIKEGMERFGILCTRVQPPRPWPGKSIFGWNSYSALGMGLRLSHWEEAGKFFREELPEFRNEEDVAYVNLDGCFGMSRKEIRRIVDQLHQNGQKAGWYVSVCNAISVMGMMPVSGTLTPLNKLYLKDDRGEHLPPADNSIPLDVTHPLWEKHARSTIRSVLDLGFDYIKLDFLSHAGVEGCHYRKEFTGRMALNHAYRIIEDEISKADREIFVSLSIAPLFPYFLGNARRSCCDSFGHIEDTRYVLNALNFAWWTNGTLYRYNDPDHLALHHSVIDGRDITTEAEARSRYNSGVISGTLMILSDNYGPEGDSCRIAAARERTKALVNNPRLNELARLGKAFVPVDLGSDTCPFYTLSCEGRFFAAVFNFSAEEKTLGFRAVRGGLPERSNALNLHNGSCFAYDGEFCVTLDGFDSAIFEIL